MRDFIQDISSYAKGLDSAFIVITQNGQELLTVNGEGTGTPVTDYVAGLDGIGQEDLFFDGIQLSSTDVTSLNIKNNGSTRLVIGYMSIGEAEDYRYYWDSAWDTTPPSWLAEENPDWPGNYKVHYWQQGWKDIISGNASSYLKKILDSGFNGVYLDIIDAFEYFESQ